MNLLRKQAIRHGKSRKGPCHMAKTIASGDGMRKCRGGVGRVVRNGTRTRFLIRVCLANASECVSYIFL
jgi:hypothetical protein